MAGASPATTIYGPPKALRSIVVAPLAGAMPPCGPHASGPRLRKIVAHPWAFLATLEKRFPAEIL